VGDLRRRDLRAALEVVQAVAVPEGRDPFPLPVLRELQRLMDADSCGGYVESNVMPESGRYDVATRPRPPWLDERLKAVGVEDPTHASHCRDRTEPVAISDFLSRRAFSSLRIYEQICEPLGVADSLRLYLPSPPGTARFFFFDRSRRGYSERARLLLETLRPHLVSARRRFGDHHHAAPARLTARELDVMRLVAAGATNRFIAHELWVTEHTVRKHLENVYAKLDVHTRTAAVKQVFGASTAAPPAF